MAKQTTKRRPRVEPPAEELPAGYNVISIKSRAPMVRLKRKHQRARSAFVAASRAYNSCLHEMGFLIDDSETVRQSFKIIDHALDRVWEEMVRRRIAVD